jgi:hypothetical protein
VNGLLVRPSFVYPMALVTASLGAAACSEPGCVRLSRPAALLAEPRPEGLGAANRVVDTLQPGEYHYSDVRYGKDFMMYELRAPTGVRGFVLYTSTRTRSCAQPDTASQQSGA